MILVDSSVWIDYFNGTRTAEADYLDTESALRSADLFRFLRKKGITIRKTVDLFIAVFCMDRGISLLTTDREFKAFEEYCGLVNALI